MAEILKTFPINIDLRRSLTYDEFELVEGDTGNVLYILLTDDGVPVDLTDAIVRPTFAHSKTTYQQDSSIAGQGVTVGTGTDKNEITIRLKSESFNPQGITLCELPIFSGDGHTTLVTTQYFAFTAHRALTNDDTIQAQDKYPILLDLIAQCNALLARDQSNYAETDTLSPTYIRNKPVIGTDVQAPTNTLTVDYSPVGTDVFAIFRTAVGHLKLTLATMLGYIRTQLFGSTTGIPKIDVSGGISEAVANTDYAAAEHKSRHATGGADAMVPSDIGAQAAMTAGVDYADPTLISMTGNYGVFTGGAVTAQGTPDQTVAVSAGSIITPEGKRYAFDAVASLAATAADATNPRIDIVYATSAGVVTYLAGTAAGSPVQPSTPSNGTILAAITRAANDNTIATSDISDRRDFISTASDLEDVTSVTEAANEFYCDFAKKHTKNFSFTITNATAKAVFFGNVPYGTCDAVLAVKATGTAAVTWVLDGRTVAWSSGAPTLTSGYTYVILFSYIPILGKWVGYPQIGVAN